MNVRSTVKAIILHEGNVLLNRCRDVNNGEYYSLPGGGQEQFESLAEAIQRECLEETGYTVEPVRFVALMEEICLDPIIRERYLQYAHKMLHLFLCRLTTTDRAEPTETDDLQVAIEWISAEEVAAHQFAAERSSGGVSKIDYTRNTLVFRFRLSGAQPWIRITTIAF